MLQIEEAHAFAAEWIVAWNLRDIECILQDWADDCVFTSPIAAKLMGGSGTVRGKDALRDYWTRCLAASPGLHFALKRAPHGHESLVICGENRRAQFCAGWLRLDDSRRAIEGAAHYTSGRVIAPFVSPATRPHAREE